MIRNSQGQPVEPSLDPPEYFDEEEAEEPVDSGEYICWRCSGTGQGRYSSVCTTCGGSGTDSE